MILIITLFFTLALTAQAQVAIDTDPEESATLNIGMETGVNRGLLIPRMSFTGGLTQWAGNAEPKVHSLMLFDTDYDHLIFWNSSITAWQIMNPWVGRYSSTAPEYTYTNLRVGIGVSAPSDTLQLHVQGDAKVEGVLSADRLVGEVPPGGIIMYSGDLANFNADGSGKADTKYEGWQLCNGQNGAPDLRGRFIVGYNSTVTDYNTLGKTGGVEQVTLTAAQSGLPSHNHSINHGHNINDPGHRHKILTGRNGGNGEITKMDKDNAAEKETKDAVTNITIIPFSGNSGNSTTQDAAAPHENRPPYMVLAYIMKL